MAMAGIQSQICRGSNLPMDEIETDAGFYSKFNGLANDRNRQKLHNR